ncbi:MAG: hypothetical protein IT227_06455 [Flavobacteriales bacterium]|nr:hypothetical protein [Flavobacteriales bacterium]
MIHRELFAALVLCAAPVLGQDDRWMKLLHGAGGPDLIGGVDQAPDSTYRTIVRYSTGATGVAVACGLDTNGDLLWWKPTSYSAGTLQCGLSRCVGVRADGTWLWVGALYPTGTTDLDVVVTCFSAEGDSLWTKQIATPIYDGPNGTVLLPDGGFAVAGFSDPGLNQFYLMRFADNGDTLWTRTLGNPQLSEMAYSIDTTADGGFILAGYKVQTGGQYDMHVMKTDANGQLQWQRSYGSPWSDNVGFITRHSAGGYLLAGARRLRAQDLPKPALYRLAEDGIAQWSQVYPEHGNRVFFTRPIEMGDGGCVVGGTASDTLTGTVLGMAMRLAVDGDPIWHRTYSTNNVLDQYVYDIRRTLDGGFILAGTAFDSALVSQDAWLVKVDSFGCLVPGCQVFDAVVEQVTDLRDALRVWPNPVQVQGQVQVAIELPAGFSARGALRLALTDAQGRLVQEETLPQAVSGFSFPLSAFPPGLYHVHLLDGSRWLSGAKVVVSPP